MATGDTSFRTCAIVLATKGILGSALSLTSKGILCQVDVEIIIIPPVTGAPVDIGYTSGGGDRLHRTVKKGEKLKKIKLTINLSGTTYYMETIVDEDIYVNASNINVIQKSGNAIEVSVASVRLQATPKK